MIRRGRTGSGRWSVRRLGDASRHPERENYNVPPVLSRGMGLSLETDCPDCDSTEFYKAASTRIHLGTKKKWHCTGCDYGFVTINGIDTSV